MNIDKETQKTLQELQMGEQNFQNFLMQKQAFQLELNEAESALEEVKKAEDEVYKIAGGVMIKAKKEDLVKELSEKQKILKMRVKSIENQEKILKEKLDSTKKELEKKFTEKKK